jgi:hypothetical protein
MEDSMVAEMNRLLDVPHRRSGSADDAIADSEKRLGVKLPAQYVEFLKLTNGYEGLVGKACYVMLWRVEELDSMNEAYEVQKYAPGLLIFGSDGGGEAYGFDTREPQWPIVQVPFIPMDWNEAQPTGSSFNAFLEQLHETEQ